VRGQRDSIGDDGNAWVIGPWLGQELFPPQLLVKVANFTLRLREATNRQELLCAQGKVCFRTNQQAGALWPLELLIKIFFGHQRREGVGRAEEGVIGD